ncbi:MAG: hypothetical protein ACW99G_17875 [Candidatus Thorarchaeota archaeon]|jgi:hypothetical protein
MPQITIGSEFFAKAKNDYDNWIWALVREFFQNSIDCRSNEINVEVVSGTCVEGESITVLRVQNDGTVMTKDILVDKLLSLGSSGKNFENGSTGGFGKAKEILYFCHEDYSIHSGSLKASGSGASYDLTDDNEYFDGTTSEITIQGDHEEKLLEEIERFILFAQWRGTFIVNGLEHRADLHKGSLRRDMGFAKVYTNKQSKNVMVVRINGIPMFFSGARVNRCVIVELKGNSNEVLTSNRDGLVSPHRWNLDDFVQELAVDNRSALKKKVEPTYTHYAGQKLTHAPSESLCQTKSLINVVDAVFGESEMPSEAAKLSSVEIGSNEVVHGPVPQEIVNSRVNEAAGYAPEVVFRRPVSVGADFILKNETKLKVPVAYDPGSEKFSNHSKKLVKCWGRILVELHRIFDVSADFSIGFLFDLEAEACYESSSDYGTIYFICPCKLNEEGQKTSWRKRFQISERDRLIAIAAHEFVHGLGLEWHDERYACKLTDVMGVVMANRKKFNWCFK